MGRIIDVGIGPDLLATAGRPGGRRAAGRPSGARRSGERVGAPARKLGSGYSFRSASRIAGEPSYTKVAHWSVPALQPSEDDGSAVVIRIFWHGRFFHETLTVGRAPRAS